VRFGSEDGVDDVTGEFDFPTNKPRRGAVKDTDGYASDSSNEDLEATGVRPRAANADNEEDDDMFGGAGSTAGQQSGVTNTPDLDAKDNDTRVKDGGLLLQGSAGKGGKEYLELGDIEGQEFTNPESSTTQLRLSEEEQKRRQKVTEEDVDYVDGEEHANDDDAVVPQERKSAEGMGFAMSSFNMQDEMKEGRFSADGSYIANDKDPDAVHDQWLTALTAKDLAAAAEAKKRQDELYASRTTALANASVSRVDCLKQLIEGDGGLVKEGESVQMALSRLGKARKLEAEEEKERLKKERRANQAKRPKKDFDAPDEQPPTKPATAESAKSVEKQDMDVDNPLSPPNPAPSSIPSLDKGKSREAEPVSATKQAIDRLTSLASTLLGTHGETDIYEETHEGIIRQLVAEGEVPRGWKPSNTAPSATAAAQKAGNSTAAPGASGRRGVVSRPLIARPRS